MEESLGKQAVGGEVPEAIVPAGPGSAAKDPSNGASRRVPASTLSDKEAYDRAQQHYGQGHYDVALTSFRLFLVQYPDSPLVPNAHFWMGECYVRAHDYERGLEQYEHVVRKYPKSTKAAPALYRKAMTFLELNNKEAARSARSEEHTSELQSLAYLVCRLLLEKKKNNTSTELRAQS